MEKEIKEITNDLKKKFKVEISEFRDEISLLVSPEKIVEVCKSLKKDHGFEQLSSLTAVDYWPEIAPRFHVVYQMNSYSKKIRLELRVPLDGNNPSVDSVESVYPNANWFEREIWDMLGVTIDGHSDPRRILMPHDWEGHPLRKDYPLGYEEVQFTFNHEEIQKRKPNPKD
ncbi:MAG: NADH-quinone oxidoreductase subunit C [Chloroflexi bacterium]|jgi:NADH-quinone oxidoreductase subunit C|nr:NADH-quinone oxidoreductase subunit C [Chloroflexota bacterium]MBT3669188.1 NADH-quinone oxidoreductase subunit C [Chloroflexota bacterium]MBT4002724.1 NADH-quinone oxidoreductase subunit C [Chloroflexota bacterium]MBT4306433.1 NADH-quinone oxidoreductase subunit C [Chloroflexota bacterium]MBT4534932.1 NADH-quinone oxidoreductase subunit C [Chloroflexota bacterium]